MTNVTGKYSFRGKTKNLEKEKGKRNVFSSGNKGNGEHGCFHTFIRIAYINLHILLIMYVHLIYINKNYNGKT